VEAEYFIQGFALLVITLTSILATMVTLPVIHHGGIGRQKTCFFFFLFLKKMAKCRVPPPSSGPVGDQMGMPLFPLFCFSHSFSIQY
jgi:hypothetical protein